MNILDGLNHAINGMAPALFVGGVSALAAKLIWPVAFKAVRWRRLAAGASGAGGLASLLGIFWTGHDGQMLTYVLVIMANGGALWWWGGRRRHVRVVARQRK